MDEERNGKEKEKRRVRIGDENKKSYTLPKIKPAPESC